MDNNFQDLISKIDASNNNVASLIKLLKRNTAEERRKPTPLSEEKIRKERLKEFEQKLIELRFEKNLIGLKEDLAKKQKSNLEKEYDNIKKKRESIKSDLEAIRESRKSRKEKDPLKYLKAAEKFREEGDIFGSWLFNLISKRKKEEERAEEYLRQTEAEQAQKEEELRNQKYQEEERLLTSLVEKLKGSVAEVKPVITDAIPVEEQKAPEKVTQAAVEQQITSQEKLTDAILVEEQKAPEKVTQAAVEQQITSQEKLTDAIRENSPKEEIQAPKILDASIHDYSKESLKQLKETLLEAFKEGNLAKSSDMGMGIPGIPGLSPTRLLGRGASKLGELAVGGGEAAAALKGASKLGRIIPAAKGLAKFGGPAAGLLTAGISLMSGESAGKAASKGIGAGAGTVVGGAIGALGGPIGAFIGATVGGYLGEKLGDKFYGFLEDSNFQETVKDFGQKIDDWNILGFFNPTPQQQGPARVPAIAPVSKEMLKGFPADYSQDLLNAIGQVYATEGKVPTKINLTPGKNGERPTYAAGLGQFIPSTAVNLANKLKTEHPEISNKILEAAKTGTPGSEEYKKSVSAAVTSLSAEQQNIMYAKYLERLLTATKAKGIQPGFDLIKAYGFAPDAVEQSINRGTDVTAYQLRDITGKETLAAKSNPDFVKYDKNNDGVLTVNELLDGIRSDEKYGKGTNLGPAPAKPIGEGLPKFTITSPKIEQNPTSINKPEAMATPPKPGYKANFAEAAQQNSTVTTPNNIVVADNRTTNIQQGQQGGEFRSRKDRVGSPNPTSTSQAMLHPFVTA